MGKKITSGKFHDQLIKEWKEKNTPQVYKDAVALKAVIESALALETHEPDTEAAAKRVVAKLGATIKAWDHYVNSKLEVTLHEGKHFYNEDITKLTGPSPLELKIKVQNFAQECTAIVKENKTQLMKDPGFWEQIAQAINNFVGKHVFDVKDTQFGADEKVKKGMEDLGSGPSI